MVRIIRGSQIFGLTNFPDFSSIFSPFSSVSVFHLINLQIQKIYLINTLKLKSQGKYKNKNWLKFHLSCILGKFPRLFPHWNKFSHFSSSCGNIRNNFLNFQWFFFQTLWIYRQCKGPSWHHTYLSFLHKFNIDN